MPDRAWAWESEQVGERGRSGRLLYPLNLKDRVDRAWGCRPSRRLRQCPERLHREQVVNPDRHLLSLEVLVRDEECPEGPLLWHPVSPPSTIPTLPILGRTISTPLRQARRCTRTTRILPSRAGRGTTLLTRNTETVGPNSSSIHPTSVSRLLRA